MRSEDKERKGRMGLEMTSGLLACLLGHALRVFCLMQYGTLLIVDPEEEFYEEEIAKLHRDVEQHGLGLIMFADWYNVDTMVKMRFFDDNTRSWWTPVTGNASLIWYNKCVQEVFHMPL